MTYALKYPATPVPGLQDIDDAERKAVAEALRHIADAFERGAIGPDAAQRALVDEEDLHLVADWWKLECDADAAFADETDFDEDELVGLRQDVATTLGIAAMAVLQARQADPIRDEAELAELRWAHLEQVAGRG